MNNIRLTIHTERLHDDGLWIKIKEIVSFFNKKNIRATWFSFNPSFLVYRQMGFDEQKWIERLRYLANHNQYIEQHTHFYEKEKGDYNLSPEHIKKRISEDKNWLEKQGYKIRGFVSGGWRINKEILQILSDLGFDYDCSARTTDKAYLRDRDHLIFSGAKEVGRLWELPTGASIKEALLNFGGKKDQIIYLHDYDLNRFIIRASLKFIVLRDLI